MIKTYYKNVSEMQMSRFDDSHNSTQKWAYMKNIAEEVIDDMCPIKTFKINQIKQPWITPPLIELIKDKYLAPKRAKIGKTKNYGNKLKGYVTYIQRDCDKQKWTTLKVA